MTSIVESDVHITNGFSSRSRAYETREELIEDNEILPDPCYMCGSIIKANYASPIGDQIKDRNLCFFCNFWLEIQFDKDNPRRFFIDHNAYFMKDDDPNASFQGFGGCLFIIKKDDKEIHTHNLWHNGEIPELFWDKI
jgi:hypothetical protein